MTKQPSCRTAQSATGTPPCNRSGSLTAGENPNGATMLVLVDGVEAEDIGSYARCADLFDGNHAEAVEAARTRWRRARDAGHTLTYWQQTISGWERKA